MKCPHVWSLEGEKLDLVGTILLVWIGLEIIEFIFSWLSVIILVNKREISS
jgi:hypothetical protein